MDHNIVQASFGLRLRPIRVEDAQFILELRCNPQLNRFIHETPNDIELQKKWLKDYLNRENDYYFCAEIEKTGKPVGLVAIYNILKDKSNAEWGRWVVAPDILAAPSSAYLIHQIALEHLGLSQIYSRTVIDNVRVVSFHDRMGAERHGILENDTMIHGELKHHVLHQVNQKRWGIIKSELFIIADKTARFLE